MNHSPRRARSPERQPANYDLLRRDHGWPLGKKHPEMLAEKKPVPEIMQNLSRKAIENDDKDDTTLIVAEISRI